MNRRLFVNRLTHAAAGLSLYDPTALAAEKRKLSRIGMQLYTVRRELGKDFEGTLARVAALGYREAEFAGYFNRPPKDVRAALARHRLNSPAAHVPLAALRGSLQEMIDAAHVV